MIQKQNRADNSICEDPTSIDGSMVSEVKVDLEAPAWDLSSEYSSVEDEKFVGDLERLLNLIEKVQKHGEILQGNLKDGKIDDLAFKALLPVAESMRENMLEASVLNWDLSAYVCCFLSVESSNDAAKKMERKLDEVSANYNSALIPLDEFEVKISDSHFDKYIESPAVRDAEFVIRQKRAFLRDFILPPGEEKLLVELSPSGFDAWWNLYSEISKQIKIEVDVEDEKKELGLAEADELLADPNRQTREDTWRAISKAWKVHELTAAQGINSLAGIRLKENELRSGARTRHYLDSAFYEGGVQAETVEAMIAVVKKNLPTAHKAMALVAKAIGDKYYEPWDYYAPLPSHLKDEKKEESKITFPDAIALVKDAFSAFHPEMGEFVDRCVDDRMIEARSLPGKAPGAYSHAFSRSGKAPVYMTYSGTPDQIVTLAHELGHSLHTYSMNDLPFFQRHYPMTVAETASNVGEMLLSGHKLANASAAEKIEAGWEEMQAGISYLVNLPLRFSFEKSVYEKRSEEFLTPKDLSNEMIKAHEEWYGNGMNTKDEMFWASKEHFHFNDSSFYNFSYTFGYMFASGVYRRILSEGSNFYPAYINLLRDTGKMTAEDLAEKHLGVDLREEEFWQSSYDYFSDRVKSFEAALDSIAPE